MDFVTAWLPQVLMLPQNPNAAWCRWQLDSHWFAMSAACLQFFILIGVSFQLVSNMYLEHRCMTSIWRSLDKILAKKQLRQAVTQSRGRMDSALWMNRSKGERWLWLPCCYLELWVTIQFIDWNTDSPANRRRANGDPEPLLIYNQHPADAPTYSQWGIRVQLTFAIHAV